MKVIRSLLPFSVASLFLLVVLVIATPWQRNIAFLGLSKLFLGGHELVPAMLRDQAHRFFAESSDCGATPCVIYQTALERRVEVVESEPYLASQLGRATLNIGIDAQKRGDEEAAYQYYANAANTSTRQIQVEAVVRQTALAASLQAPSILTDIQAGAMVSFPFISTVRCSDLQPVDIYVDLWDVTVDAPVHWAVLWEAIDGQKSPVEGMQVNAPAPARDVELIQAGSHLLQTGVGKNIILDGGFENVLAPRSGVPQALPHALYSAQAPGDTVVESVTNAQGSSMALVLKGNDRGLVGLGSAVMAITDTQSSAYLVVGKYRSDHDARPQIGLRWLANANTMSEVGQSTYVVTTPSTDWQHFAGILAPPPGITALQLWVLSAIEGTNIWVDDLAVIELQLPCTPVIPS